MQVFPRKVILRVDSKCKLSSRMFASNLYGLWCVSPALPHSLIHLYKFCMWSESNRHITRARWKKSQEENSFYLYLTKIRKKVRKRWKQTGRAR